ncbi:MAG TPA: hypothetical protein VK762_21915 [Polyangiaceae bacterium]|jgi:hypothetical protein|nr:hypothetical protein [Polyangiaceae bacterium]
MRSYESDSDAVVVTTPGAGPVSRVRWGSVLAGAVTFLSVALLLWGLGFAIVSFAAHPTSASTRAGALALWICAMATTIVGAIVGGWFAGRSLVGASRGFAAAHGFLTWGVALLVSFGFQMFALRGLVTAAVSDAADSAAMNSSPGAQSDVASEQRIARDYLAGASWSWFATWLVAGAAATAMAAAGSRILPRSLVRERSVAMDEIRQRPLTPTTVP